jgi:hypothetical protein
MKILNYLHPLIASLVFVSIVSNSCTNDKNAHLQLCINKGDSLKLKLKTNQTFVYSLHQNDVTVSQEMETIFNFNVLNVVADTLYELSYTLDSTFFNQKSTILGIDNQHYYNSTIDETKGVGKQLRSQIKKMNARPPKITLSEKYEVFLSGYEIFYQFYRLKNQQSEYKLAQLMMINFLPEIKKPQLSIGSSWSYFKNIAKGNYNLKEVSDFEVINIFDETILIKGKIKRNLSGKSIEFMDYESTINVECEYFLGNGWIQNITAVESIEATQYFRNGLDMKIQMTGNYYLTNI